MSRLGKNPIAIPSGVEVTLTDGVLSVKGPKGTLHQPVKKEVNIIVEPGQVVLTPANDGKDAAALWGTYASILTNFIVGVTEGYQKKLQIEGVGYRAEASGNKLTLNVGFSHPVVMEVPEGLTTTVEKSEITIAGIDKHAVGQFAANVRKVKEPEPYKGKGIRYQGEHIIRKQGKKAV